MIKEPYQTSDNKRWWDYNFRIRGIVYEISVHKKIGTMILTVDKDPSVNLKLNGKPKQRGKKCY